MSHYSMMTGEGGDLGIAQTCAQARAWAQLAANERGETVYIAGPGMHTAGTAEGSDEDIGEAVEPEDAAAAAAV